MSSKQENDPSDPESNPPLDNKWIEGILQDPTKKAFLMQTLGLEDPPSLRQCAKPPDKGKTPADTSGGKKGSDSTGPHLPQTFTLWGLDQAALRLPLPSRARGRKWAVLR